MLGFFASVGEIAVATAQVPPSSAEAATREPGRGSAGRSGDWPGLIAKGARPDMRDGYERTPLHVAAYGGHHDAMRALVAAGGESERAGEGPVRHRHHRGGRQRRADAHGRARLGASAKNVTSRYDGTALIAAAHLGHAEVVRIAHPGGGAAGSREQPRAGRR